ncbi:capsid assembly scaffolding protein Gp46 family protein [Fructilactobacillus florum]|uniref:Phage scaffold protein n=1 Tax=Fructilactobacillus florum DSM 22689 = JCM 16035 TaxID=1423745 RepID=A0A0R2CJ04_9LACO|nr:DUF4355 domain-containing protein [Fructilactobacillus florum]KRM91592.1 hypothetical protein FC87_GL000724 [Fructilactobacillus florum DSM 22689 = JCM 16035]
MTEELKYTQADMDKAMASKAKEYDTKYAAEIEKLKAENETAIEQAKKEAKADGMKAGEERAKMTATEKAKAEYQDKLDEFNQKQEEFKSQQEEFEKQNALIATRKLLQDKKLPDSFANMLSSTDEETRKKNVEEFAKSYQSGIDKAVAEKTKGAGTPQAGGAPIDTTHITAEEFGKMNYDQQMTLYQQDADLYHKLKGEL